MVRALTFWLRPDFLVRCLRRFQLVEGFDRAIALASLTFSALIPIGIVLSGALSDHSIGQHLVERYGLKGDGAQAVSDLFEHWRGPREQLLCVQLLPAPRDRPELLARDPAAVRADVGAAAAERSQHEERADLDVRARRLRAVTGIVPANYTSGVLEVLTSAALGLLSVASWRGAACAQQTAITRHDVLPRDPGRGRRRPGDRGEIYVPRLFNSYAAGTAPSARGWP